MIKLSLQWSVVNCNHGNTVTTNGCYNHDNTVTTVGCCNNDNSVCWVVVAVHIHSVEMLLTCNSKNIANHDIFINNHA